MLVLFFDLSTRIDACMNVQFHYFTCGDWRLSGAHSTAAAALTSLGSDKSFREGDAVAMAMESQAH